MKYFFNKFYLIFPLKINTIQLKQKKNTVHWNKIHYLRKIKLKLLTLRTLLQTVIHFNSKTSWLICLHANIFWKFIQCCIVENYAVIVITNHWISHRKITILISSKNAGEI